MWVKILTNLNSERRDNISVLITGGTGYVGSHVNKFFMSKGIKTILLDNLTNSSIQSALRTGAKIYIGDYGNKKLLTEIFQEEDIDTIIIHIIKIEVLVRVNFLLEVDTVDNYILR